MALALLSGALTASAVDDWANIGRYDAANQSLKTQANTNTRVVFVGNSITDFWISNHPQFFSDNDFIDRGISGQTTYQFLVRFREDVVELNPAAVVINGGINDIAENNYAYNEDRTFGNLVSMAEIANTNGIKVIMASVLPAAQFSWNQSITNIPDKVEALNARIKAYAEEKSYPYIDYYPELVYGSERALNPAYTSDGVHPNAAGYSVMESIALPIIRSVVKLNDDLPDEAYISGAALAEAENLKLNKRGIGQFETYTKLKAGDAFTINANNINYGISDGSLAENKTISVDKSGVYRIKANFVSRTAAVEPVAGIGLFYCADNARKIELTYAGNGTFKGYGDIALRNMSWGYDNRYRLAMDLGNSVQWWGPLDDNEDRDPGTDPQYFYMKETTPSGQWDYKWKFDVSKADENHILNGIEIIVTLNSDTYNHVMNYGVEAPKLNIPSALKVEGEALSEGPSLNMTKIGDTTFELFTTLSAGKSFIVTDGSKNFMSADGEISENGTNSVDKDGIYCLNINFAKGTFDIEQVTKMTVYCCWFGGDLNEGCEYKGNGTWEQTAYWAIDDTRYKFRMDVGGKSQFWGPVNTDEDGMPDGSDSYFYMTRSTPASQWDNKWKLPNELKNCNVKWTVSLNGSQYTHTQADASASILDIEAEDGANYDYYTLQGVKLSQEPTSGLYIRRKSGHSEKVIAK